MTAEILPSGKDFMDPDGDVLSMNDWLPEMNGLLENPHTSGTIVKAGLSRARRNRRGNEPLFGGDASRLIDDAQSDEEARLDRGLTEQEAQKIAHDVAWQNRQSD